jgi:hypothetical protein
VGAVLSPLLANIALSVLDERFTRKWEALGPDWTRAKLRRQGVPAYRLVRYADDCAPRTRKEELSRSGVRRMRCCARDEGAEPVPGSAALRGRPAGGGRKPPQGAPVKSRGAELAETARHRARQV